MAMRLLRHGLFRYWQRSSQGRALSMGLLSTHDTSMVSLARQFATICAHSLSGIRAGVIGPAEVPRAIAGLAGRTASFARQAYNVGRR